MRTDQPLSIYIHYPFCVRKCRYCDFLSGPSDRKSRQEYISALERDIVFYGNNNVRVDTVFFGGGTPSVMEPEEAARIMELIKKRFCLLDDAEISMECNPGTAAYEKLAAFRALGINRLSIGVQSFNDTELKLLGRIHSAKEAVKCFYDAREAGFENISMDLMSALPGQSFDSYAKTLEKAAAMEPEHISSYSLILEEGTPLLDAYEKGLLPPLPDEDEDRKMYHFTRSFLAEKGYHRYEISNYAKEGRESRHNKGYWTGHEYLGIGLGASSCIEHTRFHVTSDMNDYLSGPDHNEMDKEILSVKDQMEEFMFLGLRLTAGISEQAFYTCFGSKIDEVYGNVIGKHLNKQLLIRENGRIFLSEYGTDIANYVMADFLFD